MEIREVMSRDVQIVSPDDTIRQAAAKMKEIDAGVLPVADGDKLVGMLTDRDIAVRAVAEGKGPDAKVRDVMTPEVKYVFGARCSSTRRAQSEGSATPPVPLASPCPARRVPAVIC
jgi:CBS domain-containing protein